MAPASSSSSSSIGAIRPPPAGGPDGGISTLRPPKRRKTPRACDYCRDHKLRCDFSHNLTQQDGKPVCKHCADFGIECVLTAPLLGRRSSVVKLEGGTPSIPEPSGSTIWQVDERAIDDPRYSGDSSLSAIISQFMAQIKGGREHLSHSTNRHPHGNGVQPTGHHNFLLLPQTRYPAPAEAGEKELINAHLDRSTIRDLIDRYLTYIQPLNAIVSRKDVLNSVDLNAASLPIIALSPIALSLLCVSAMYRETPRFTRAALLFHLRQRRTAIFRTSVETVQSLLLLSQNIELMAPDANDAAGMSFNLAGLAIRMAQDLGMHRDISLLGVAPSRVRKSARIWSSCLLVDRWYALCYGQPCLISMDDCDAPLPSFHDDDEQDEDDHANKHARPVHETHVAHYHLAILIGRIHKMAFGPRGFHMKSYGELKDCIYELNDWSASLPPHLRFSMRQSEPPSVEAGFLFAMKVSLDFLLYRISLNLPSDVPPVFRATDKWQSLVHDSAEALEWLASSNGLVCLDSYSIVLYFLVQCTIVHFYEASRGGSLHSLRVARQSLQNRGTVATQAASRGQLYDPYGPQNGSTEQPQNGSTSASADHKNTSGSKSHVPSPSPESGSGPPRLLRLRVKISGLVSMLLEVAEHRRAAVLKRNESNTVNGRPHSSSGAASTSSASAEVTPSSSRLVPLHLRPAPESQSHLSRDTFSTQPRPGSSHQQQNSSPYPVSSLLNQKSAMAAAATSANDTLAGRPSTASRHCPVPANGQQQQQQQSYYPVSSDRLRMPYGTTSSPGQGGKSLSNGTTLLPSSSSLPQQQHYHATATYNTPPTAYEAEFGMSSYATPSNGGGAGAGGSVQDSSSMTSTSPKTFDDLDLMTLQRWADALLCNPHHFVDQSQATPLAPLQHPHMLPHPSLPAYGHAPHNTALPPPPPSSSQPPAFQPLLHPHAPSHHMPHSRPPPPHLPVQYGNRLFSL